MTIQLQRAAVCLALAVLPRPAPAAPSAAAHATTVPSPIVAKATLPREHARDLYSLRARRLVMGYLRLKLLELRENDLDRARAVVEGKLGVDTLFSPSATQAGIRAGGR
jgi:hypothetical protein